MSKIIESQLKIRLSDTLRKKLEKAGEDNKRSLVQEITFRLAESLNNKDTTLDRLISIEKRVAYLQMKLVDKNV